MLSQPIVTTEWLQDHLNHPRLRIVDIRGLVKPATEPPPHYFNLRDDYDASHIPGAVFIDWVHEITDPDDPRHTQIATPARYAAVMSRAGIDENTVVVAYDTGAGVFASRLWWSLRYYGHEQVAVLDGGWDKWVSEGRPTTTAVPDISPTTFTPRPNPALRRTADEVLAALHRDDTLIIDVRSDTEYKGQASRAPRMGHIPGAVNQGRSLFMNDDNTLKSPDEIRAVFAGSGLQADQRQEVIVYCNAGVSATYSLLAMTHAGMNNGTLYDGSWKEWGSDESKPIES